MKILIGADLVPTETNKELFVTGDAETLLGAELKQLLDNADYRIFNLEVPLTDVESPIDKCGPNLITPTATVKGYRALGVDILTLANNHILDQGQQGLESTCNLLKANAISFLGVGANVSEAKKPFIFTFGERKIGIYACAEHEFSIATENKGGANPFDPLESPDHVAELKLVCDYVIVLYHGGKEHYRYPSPNLQKMCRKLVDKGADLIVCQHSHCIGCEEKYNGGTIVYGQGNFLFDYSKSEYWQTSLLIELDDTMCLSYIPLVKEGNKVRLAEASCAKGILEDFRVRSEEIRIDGTVEAKYAEFAQTMIDNYLLSMSGIRRGFCFRVINKLSGYRFAKWLMKRRYSSEKLLAMRNFVECEAHRELMLNAINRRIYGLELCKRQVD